MRNPTHRVNLYAAVHKGLRAALAQALVEAGRMDPTDIDETARVLGSVRDLITLCRTHLEHEDSFVHAAMQARRAGSAAVTLGGHEHHKQSFGEIEDAVRAVEDSVDAERVAAAGRLYALLALFVADNYEHMHIEETRNNEVLWADYTDAELLAIKGRLLAAIPPELNLAFLRWMAPNLSPAERADLLLGARPAMPAAAFDAGLALIKNHMSARDWYKLQVALRPLAAAA